MSQKKDTPSKLTRDLIKKTEGNGSKQRLKDHEVQGLALRVTPAGVKTWAVRYWSKIHKKSREMSLGGGPEHFGIEAARERALGILSAAKSGRDPLDEFAEGLRDKQQKLERTLKGVVDHYRASPAYKERRKSTRGGYDTSFNVHILPRLGDSPIEDIRRRDVALLLDTLAEERSGSVSNAARRALSVVMNYALELELVEVNPVVAVKQRHKPRVRDRVLSDEELKTTWEAAKARQGMTDTVADMVLMAMLIPARIKEISMTRRQDVNLETALWSSPGDHMKKDEAHELPLPKEALKLLRNRLAKADGNWLFPNDDGSGHMEGKRAGRACARLAKRHNWDSFGTHDLRRTYATRTAELIRDSDAIERTLAHKVGAGRAIVNYDHAKYRERKLEALTAWEKELMRIVEGRAPESNVVSIGEAMDQKSA